MDDYSIVSTFTHLIACILIRSPLYDDSEKYILRNICYNATYHICLLLAINVKHWLGLSSV